MLSSFYPQSSDFLEIWRFLTEHTIILNYYDARLSKGTTTGCSCPATQPHKEPHTQHDVSHHHSTQTHAAQRKHRVTAASRDFSTGEGNKDASRRYLFEAETQSFKLKDAELLNIKPTELSRHLKSSYQ